MLERIIRVIRLDKTVYAEVEHDESLTSEAFIIVVIASFLAALGGAIGSGRFLGSFLWSLVSGIVLSWGLWAFITQWVGTNVFDGEADLGEMLRVIGYANAPRFLGVLGFIPFIGWIFGLAGLILSLVAAFLAIQEGLDLDTPKTVATVVIGWVIGLVVNLALGALLLGPGIAMRAFTG